MSFLNIPLLPFYFIRHGETDWNQRNIVMGSQDIPLNELGFKQAYEASRILENENFDVIVSSTKMRAQQTAKILANRTKKQVLFEQGLVEISLGEAEGRSYDSIKSVFDEDHIPRGAEPFSAFQRRIIETISNILAMKKLPLIVSHGGVFKALTHHIGYKDLRASNGTPYFFKPPLESSHPWAVCNLEEKVF